MKLWRKHLGMLTMAIAVLLFCCCPIVYIYGQLFYLTFMPSEKLALSPGRNALFLTLMKGDYVLKVASKIEVDCDKWVFVKGHIQNSTSTIAVSNTLCKTSTNESFYRFKCASYVERVAIVLDLDCPTNSVDNAFAEVFPCK